MSNALDGKKDEKDIWYRWLLGRRDGEDAERRKIALQGLAPLRDKVLENARLGEDETLLDVGCGDGLIGFGALNSLPTCRVIFSDISTDLLSYCRDVARDTDNLDRCRFEQLSATDLNTIEDNSVDVVTTRSVLIYVSQKEEAFREFHRVLKPGGRISLFEPINSFTNVDRQTRYLGYDLSPVADLYAKVRKAFEKKNRDGEGVENSEEKAVSSPMIDFDERDLVTLAQRAGFEQVYLDYQVAIRPAAPQEWNIIYRSAPNPNAPTLEEAIAETLTETEAEHFISHLRPLIERGEGIRKTAMAFLYAVK